MIALKISFKIGGIETIIAIKTLAEDWQPCLKVPVDLFHSESKSGNFILFMEF